MTPMTMTEKILAKHAQRDSVLPGDNVWIDIDALTGKTCKVYVRVGALGDQVRSKDIMEMIQKYL